MTYKKNSNYGLMANFYDIVFGLLLRGIRKQVIATSNVKESKSVLEVACGTGEQALLYVKSGAIVTGLDSSESMLRVARQKNKKYNTSVDFKYGDATDLLFEENQFDISTITLALHEMDPSIRSQVVEEMARVTKSDGRIIIADYTVPKSNSVWSSLHGYAIWAIERVAGGDHYRNYSDFMKNGGLRELIKKFPLEIREERIAYAGNLGILNLSKK